MEQSAGPTSVTAWKPAVPGIREVLHATFKDHAYPPHVHDVWTVFIVDDGAIRYDLDGRAHHASGTMVSVLPPDVVHDGRPATSGGYRKRVLYVDTSVLPTDLTGAAVDRPVIGDPALRASVDRLHCALACVDDGLEAQTRFALVAQHLREALGSIDSPPTPSAARDIADALRAYLDARLFEPLTLDDAAAALGWSSAHVARAFARAFGIAPHAYVIGRRLQAARSRILEGHAIASVAVEVGFFDQAHLTRRFRRDLGTTPAAFARRDRGRSGNSGHGPL